MSSHFRKTLCTDIHKIIQTLRSLLSAASLAITVDLYKKNDLRNKYY